LQDGGVVILAGATKSTAAHRALVHGAYDLMPELYNGRVLFRKRDNKTVWLRFTTTKNWIVSSAADKEANNDVGYAFAPGSDSALPSVSGWRIHDAGGFVADEGISVTLSDALKIAVSVAVLILVTVTLLVVYWMFAARCCSIARCCITRSYGCVACVLTCHSSAVAASMWIRDCGFTS